MVSMSLESGIFSALTNDAALSALVGSRVYPVIAPQGVTAPFVVYQPIAAIPATTRGEAHEISETLVQFSCYGETYAAATQVRAALVAALDCVAIAGGDSPTLQDERSDYEEAVELHRADADFLI